MPIGERQQVDRVIRVRHEHPLGMLHVALQFGRHDAGCGRADQRLGVGGGIDLGDDVALELDALGHAFLDPVGALDRFLDRLDKSQLALLR
jgi:hypothetical protein